MVTVFSTVARADIYTYVDENGVLNFTNNHPVGRSNFRRIFKDAPSRRLFPFRMPDNTTRSDWDSHIDRTCAKYSVDPALVRAIIHTESNFNPYAVSPKGAEGLMQLMPATAGMVEVADTFDPTSNIEGGVRYFRYLLDKFKGNTRLSVAAYNAGEKNVTRYNGIPPFKETREYVRRVMSLYNSYRNQRMQ